MIHNRYASTTTDSNSTIIPRVQMCITFMTATIIIILTRAQQLS